MTAFKLGTLFSMFAIAALCQVPASLTVRGLSNTVTALSASDVAELPRQTIRITDHGKPVSFKGVLLSDVLAKVRTPTGEGFEKSAASYY